VPYSVVLSNNLRIKALTSQRQANYSLFYNIKYRTIIPYYRHLHVARGFMILLFCLIRLCCFDYSYRIIVFVKSHEPYCLAAFCSMFILHNVSIVIADLFIGSQTIVLHVEAMKCLVEV